MSLNILATLGFLVAARNQPHSTAEIMAIGAAAFGVFGTALVAITIRKEWLRLLSAVLVIAMVIVVRTTLLQG